jgi:hypothetical protein
MRDVQTLLVRCRELGAEFIPGSGGNLKVRAPAPLPEELREQLRQRKAEVLALLTQQQPDAWLCPHCGRKAEIEAVEPSRDGTRMLTFWCCLPCGVWAVTPSTLREPPVWVSRRMQ